MNPDTPIHIDDMPPIDNVIDEYDDEDDGDGEHCCFHNDQINCACGFFYGTMSGPEHIALMYYNHKCKLDSKFKNMRIINAVLIVVASFLGTLVLRASGILP